MSKRKKTEINDTSNNEVVASPVIDLEKEVLRSKILELERKLKDVTNELEQVQMRNAVVRIEVTDEETIARMQLEKLKDKVLSGGTLSLEEVKIYDILVKNKRLAQGDATTIPGTVLPESTSKKDLLRLASMKEVKDE